MASKKALLFESPYLLPIMNTWAAGIGIEHKDAVKTHTGFFCKLMAMVVVDMETIGTIDLVSQ